MRSIVRRFIRAGSRRRASLLVAFPAALVAAIFVAGWGREAHQIVTDHAFELLPPPLATWYHDHREHVRRASNGPDRRVDELKEELRKAEKKLQETPTSPEAGNRVADVRRRLQAERAKHFFDIDALTDEGPPFASFPHQEKAARKYVAGFLMRTDRPRAARLLDVPEADLPQTVSDQQADLLGRAAMDAEGTLPWTIRDTMARLTETFRKRDVDRLNEALGDLAHYVADLCQPFHTTDNYDGKLTGNIGIHGMLEIDLIERYRDEYEQPPADSLRSYQSWHYPLDVPALVFEQFGRNASLASVMVKAAAEARRRSGINDDDVAYLKGLDPEQRTALMQTTDASTLSARDRRMVVHVDALHNVLRDKFGAPVRRRLGEAASLLAAMVYTAWLDADRPPLAPAPADTTESPGLDWTTFLPTAVVLAVLLAVILRRRRQTPPADE